MNQPQRSYEAECKEQAKAVTQRLWGKPKIVNIIVEAKIEHQHAIDDAEKIAAAKARQDRINAERSERLERERERIAAKAEQDRQNAARPMWMSQPMLFDDHVRVWQAVIRPTARRYVQRRCVELGVSYQDIMRKCRVMSIVTVRHQLMKEVYDMFDLSLPQIGRVFQRDHSTVLNALRMLEKKQGKGQIMTKAIDDLIARLEKLTGPDTDLAVDINTHFEIASYITDDGDPTASIDAAVALAERVLPGWVWGVSQHGDALLYRKSGNEDGYDLKIKEGKSKPPAIALCIAILRAAKESPE